MAAEQASFSPLYHILHDHKQGMPSGIFSVCSAHPAVLETSFQVAARADRPLLIEATCNQINQDGGYTGMVPAQFAGQLKGLAEEFGYPQSSLILGGDHLGPYPWRSLPPEKAMAKACQLVEAYVSAGFTKIHLDASMPCGSEEKTRALEPSLIASRTAVLCQSAESACSRNSGKWPPPLYVIGTEVPAPGGVQDSNSGVRVTLPEDALQTIELTRMEFLKRGLASAWDRVIAVVVQPGVEFGDQIVHPYDSARASLLSDFIEGYNRLVYEAHSTDYQTYNALTQMVRDHFAILKVGPALTFAYREAVFALSWIEKEWLAGRTDVQLSELPRVLEHVMLVENDAWKDYYKGSPQEIRLSLGYSYSDRCRYYWTHPEVQASLKLLFKNLVLGNIPPTLISEFMPVQYQRMRENRIPNQPYAWVCDRIADALQPYMRACFSG